MKNGIWLIITLALFKETTLFSQEFIYEFFPGQYYILDYPINIRSQPNLNGEILGKLNLHDKIEVLEKTNNIQNINDVEAYWYKIKFNEVLGYIFGGYIAANKFIFDIDQNGVDDYLYFRFSKTIPSNTYLGFTSIIDSFTDIFIYINNHCCPV